MIWVVLAFLGVSLYLYCLLGGADFGAGMLELFSKGKERERQEELSIKALGPVWEANHVWLIIAIVILFVGFPAVYAAVSTYYHIPLFLMLIGVVFRGTSFMFRHYDAVHDRSRRWYSAAFAYSSLVTPVMFGVIAGALGTTAPAPPGPGGYYETYVAHWLRPFPFAAGIFTSCLFASLAAVFMIGEAAPGAEKTRFEKRAILANLLTVAAGAGVFVTAQLTGCPLARVYWEHPFSFASVVYATVTLPLLWWALNRGRVWTSRVLAGSQAAAILAGWYAPHFPNVLYVQGRQPLTFFGAAAPEAALAALGWSLILGSAAFLPTFVWLIRTFKTPPQ